MITFEAATRTLLEGEDRPVNVASVGALRILLPSWRLEVSSHLPYGKDVTRGRLEAARNFTTKVGVLTKWGEDWEVLRRYAVDGRIGHLLSGCKEVSVYGSAPEDNLKYLNTSTGVADKFLLESTVVVKDSNVFPFLTTHFVAHLMEIDLCLENAGVNLNRHVIDQADFAAI